MNKPEPPEVIDNALDLIRSMVPLLSQGDAASLAIDFTAALVFALDHAVSLPGGSVSTAQRLAEALAALNAEQARNPILEPARFERLVHWTSRFASQVLGVERSKETQRG